MAKDISDQDIIKFPCEGCGKILGGHQEMRSVLCSRCATTNAVPNREEATKSMSEKPLASHIVSFDIPFGTILLLGFKISIAAVPLVALLMLAVCGTYFLINFIEQLSILP